MYDDGDGGDGGDGSGPKGTGKPAKVELAGLCVCVCCRVAV